MADDQTPKTMDINDLVRELSKNSTSPVTPSPSSQAPKLSFPTQKPMTSPPMTGSSPASLPLKPLEMPKPKFNVPPPPFGQPSQPKPAIPTPTPSSSVSGSSAPLPSTTPGVKEYQSSIRTMNEDISKLKQGQKPMGIDVPRKVEQVIPVPSQPIPQPMPPLVAQIKPIMPNQPLKIPSVNLDQAPKIGSLNQLKDFSRPVPVVPRFVPNVPKVEPKIVPIEPKTQIYVPQEGPKMGINRNVLFLGIGAAALIAGFLYWFFVLRSPAPEVVIESPTPTITPTATPVQDLSSMFSAVNTENVTVVNPAVDINKDIQGLSINGGEFKSLNVTSESKGQFVLGLIDFLAKPDQFLVDNMGADHKVLLYGQKEMFDSKGQPNTASAVEKRLVFINEVKDASAAPMFVKDWEINMFNDLKTIFGLTESKKQSSLGFQDNSYGGINVRYKNFPYADKSIDYAIVPALNGKTYLVIGGSRESVYSAIDKLKGY